MSRQRALGAVVGLLSIGLAAFSADGSGITFTPTPGFTGIYSYRYNLVNGAAVQQLAIGGDLLRAKRI